MWQTPPLGWRISRSSSTDELVYVNEYNEEEVSMLLTDFQDNLKNKFVCKSLVLIIAEGFLRLLLSWFSLGIKIVCVQELQHVLTCA